MTIILYIIIFLISCITLSWLGSRLIKILVRVAKYLQLREFIVGFFVMAVATSFPNLFVGINAALHKIPELSLGDIVGGNILDLTVVTALAVFFSRKGLPAESRMIQRSAIFTSMTALLPLLLLLDKKMTRVDGIILLLAFVLYSSWLFSKEERFKKVYNTGNQVAKEGDNVKSFFSFLKDFGKMVFLLAALLAASQGIVASAQFFSQNLAIPVSVIGLLIVGLGNVFPETYFSIVSARKNQNWMVLGDLMGSVVICATLVLGIVVLISPFEVQDITPFYVAMIFSIIAAIFSLIVIKTGKKITKKEGIILLAIYVAFLISEIFLRQFLWT